MANGTDIQDKKIPSPSEVLGKQDKTIPSPEDVLGVKKKRRGLWRILNSPITIGD